MTDRILDYTSGFLMQHHCLHNLLAVYDLPVINSFLCQIFNVGGNGHAISVTKAAYRRRKKVR